MKNLCRITLLVLVPFLTFAQSKSKTHSCCSADPNAMVANWSKDESFVAAHQEPEEIDFVAETGEMIKFKTTGAEANAFIIKSEKPSKEYVFVFQEWWGLNDHIKKEAEDLQKRLGNVNVIAIDLYDGKVATNREDAAKFMGEAKPERCVEIINGAIAYVGKDAKIATIGWCFGGGWSLQAALLAGKQAKACVVYYGMPETDVEKLKKLNCKVLGVYANQDKWISPEVVKTFEANMKTANKSLTVKMYDADHAFANPSNPQYKEADRTDAMNNAVKFYQEEFIGKK